MFQFRTCVLTRQVDAVAVVVWFGTVLCTHVFLPLMQIYCLVVVCRNGRIGRLEAGTRTSSLRVCNRLPRAVQAAQQAGCKTSLLDVLDVASSRCLLRRGH